MSDESDDDSGEVSGETEQINGVEDKIDISSYEEVDNVVNKSMKSQTSIDESDDELSNKISDNNVVQDSEESVPKSDNFHAVSSPMLEAKSPSPKIEENNQLGEESNDPNEAKFSSEED